MVTSLTDLDTHTNTIQKSGHWPMQYYIVTFSGSSEVRRWHWHDTRHNSDPAPAFASHDLHSTTFRIEHVLHCVCSLSDVYASFITQTDRCMERERERGDTASRGERLSKERKRERERGQWERAGREWERDALAGWWAALWQRREDLVLSVLYLQAAVRGRLHAPLCKHCIQEIVTASACFGLEFGSPLTSLVMQERVCLPSESVPGKFTCYSFRCIHSILFRYRGNAARVQRQSDACRGLVSSAHLESHLYQQRTDSEYMCLFKRKETVVM